jgi:hypothetical protein
VRHDVRVRRVTASRNQIRINHSVVGHRRAVANVGEAG